MRKRTLSSRRQSGFRPDPRPDPRQARRDGQPSLAVAVARDGEILWEKGLLANREDRVAATPI